MANTKQGIYYQDNYSSVADVPSDMKKMAESVDTELEKDRGRLSTTETNIQSLQSDNTTNKQNISNIKQEQTTQNANIEQNTSDIANINEEIVNINKKDTAQDTNIETLQKRLTEKDNQIAELEDKVSDLNNNQIYGKASGEYVHLVDSAKMNCDIAVLGNSRQETREGYNKLPYPYSESTATKNGITFTVNEDGTIKVNGTPTADTYFYLYTGKISDFKNIAELNGKKVKITQSPTGTNSTYYLSMYNFGNDSKSVYTQGRDSSYVTVDNQGQNVNIALCVKSGYVANNLVISPMILLEGETATAYEQYGAMPSLDYPSEIEPVGDNKNLFDGELENGGIDYQNGTFDSNTDRVRSKNFIKLDPNLHYTISRIDGSGKPFGIRGYDENKNYVGYIVATTSKIFTFIPQTSSDTDMPNPNTKFCYMKFIDLDNNLNARYKLEKGTVETPYSSYNCGSANVKVCNKNLFPILQSQSIERKGITFSYNADKQEFNAKGTTIDTSFYTSLTFDELSYLDKDKKYIVSIDKNTPNNCALQLTKINEIAHITISSNGNNGILNNLEKGKPNGIMFFASNIEVGTNIDFTFKVQIEESTTATDYIPHEEQNYPVDIQEEMLEGDYFDLENGKEVHNWQKIESYNAEEITTEYKSTTGELSTGATVYYKLAEPRKLDLTENQTQQLQALLKAKTYKNITNITTDTIAVLDVDYKRDLETYQKQQDDRITAIEQLLSTTATSAMLLDNVQSDLESEVK